MKNQNYFTARHFIMIPFEDENFIASYEELCAKLKSENPENFDPVPYMEMLNVMESRGYTTAFFDSPLPRDAHNYDTGRSASDYHAAGVIIAKTDSCITMELRNEIKTGDEINFVLPGRADKLTVKIQSVINATNDMFQSKMSAGQGNAIKIPREWVEPHNWDNLSPLVLSYKRK